MNGLYLHVGAGVCGNEAGNVLFCSVLISYMERTKEALYLGKVQGRRIPLALA